MGDFNFGRARDGRGSYQNSQAPNYGNNERYMRNTGYQPERPGYRGNTVQSQGYNYSNIYDDDEFPRIPSGLPDSLRTDNAANRNNASSREAASSNFSRGGRDVVNSNDGTVRGQQYYNPSRPTGDSFIRITKEEVDRDAFTNPFNPNTATKPTINNQKSVSNNYSGGAHNTRETFMNPINPNQVQRENVTNNFGGLSSTSVSGGSRYIPPPPQPPPVPPVLNYHSIPLITSIINNVNSTTAPKQTTVNPNVNIFTSVRQSVTAGRSHQGISSTPQFSRDVVDDPYAPIICSTTSTASPLSMGKQLFKAAFPVNKPLYTPKSFTAENTNMKQTLQTDQGKPVSMARMTTSNLSFQKSTDSTHPFESAISSYNSGHPPNNRDSGSGGRNFRPDVDERDHENFFWKNQSTKRKMDDDESRDENTMTSSWGRMQHDNIGQRGGDTRHQQFNKFEKNYGPQTSRGGMRGNKRPHNKAFGGKYGDGIPRKRSRQDSTETKNQRIIGDYDDGWHVITCRKYKFRQLFLIQAKKINELMSRLDRPIEIPRTPTVILSTNIYDLTEEQILNQAFQDQREKLREIAEERTAKKRERRRRRKMNKKEFIKHFLGKV